MQHCRGQTYCGREKVMLVKSKIKIIFLTALFLLMVTGCSSIIYKSAFPTLSDGKYDSEFPYKGSSEELEQISKTIHRVSSLAFYRSYIFNSGTKVKLQDINSDLLKNKANSVGYFDKSSSGTAVTIYSEGDKIALLTCAHVISFPDTIFSYFADESGRFTDYLESISIKERQLIFIAGFPSSPADGTDSDVDLLAIDKDKDLAVLGRTFSPKDRINFPVFPYPEGSAKQLEWGSFVYVFGYPMNYKMVSKAIVSSPDLDGQGTFLIDAVVNRGFSGGIVLGIRDGVPNFEFVGIIRSVPEEVEYMLQPEKLRGDIQYSPIVPYRGDIYAVQQEQLKYGITRVIPIEMIKNFLNDKSGQLLKLGFNIKKFF